MTTPLDDLLLNELTPHYVAKNIASYLQVKEEHFEEVIPEMVEELDNEQFQEQALEYYSHSGFAENSTISPDEFVDFLKLTSKMDYATLEEEEASRLYQFIKKTDGDEEAEEFLQAFKDGNLQSRDEYNQAKIEEIAKLHVLQQQAQEKELAALDLYTEQERDAYDIARYTGMALRRFLVYGHKENNEVEVLEAKENYASKVKLSSNIFEDYLSRSIDDGIISLEDDWVNKEEVKSVKDANLNFKSRALEWLKQELYSRIADGSECRFLEDVLVKKDKDEKLILTSARKKKPSLL